ncbi:hypothetical protein [Chroococcidiopsis sp. SAG 2025]|uniref:hypothetical protein n=1 Tax=Chroococcidiopsis sp. SAG 2025 TaxID=171389 RepID=UPI002936E5F4|nr:hypothetical protein [Chroococcidiopsis sp. SAG 2025]
MLYKKQTSRIASPTIRPIKGHCGWFAPLGELAIAFDRKKGMQAPPSTSLKGGF